MNKMKYISLILILFWCTPQETWAQKGILKVITKIPGNFAFDIGVVSMDKNENIDFLIANSRSINGYFIFDLGIKAKGFSLNPGIGISSENYHINKQVLAASNNPAILQVQSNPRLKKSKFNATYFDIPLELRWASNVGRKAFRVTVGAKTGFLLNSHTKMVQKNHIKIKEKKDYHFNAVRSTVYGRIGYNWYSFFASYGLNNFFDDQSGQNGIPMMFGISLVGYR